jgi:hypothetical protein
MEDKLLEVYAKQISPSSIRDYVKSKHWVPVEGIARRLWVFRHPTEVLRQVIIPTDIDSDFPFALNEIILRLAEVEARPYKSILESLVSPYSDVLRFQVGGEEYSSGMLPMNNATDLIEGARKAVLSSACSVFNKTTHHPRMSHREAEEFLNVCKMGQTEIGSYIVKFLCPLDKMSETPFAETGFPFAREATSLLMRASHKLLLSIEDDTITAMLNEQKETPEISSNLCDALLQMHGTMERSNLSISVSWAPVSKCGVPDIPTVITFKPEYFSVIEEVSTRLKPKDKEKADTYIGTVEALSGTVGDDERRDGDVTFVFLVDGDSVKARGNLNPDNYHIACEAHDAGKKYVSFKARLIRKSGRLARLENISDFHVVAD